MKDRLWLKWTQLQVHSLSRSDNAQIDLSRITTEREFPFIFTGICSHSFTYDVTALFLEGSGHIDRIALWSFFTRQVSPRQQTFLITPL